MHINWQLSKLNLKIVYYGPALSGKTTNLEHIYRAVDPTRRSKLVSLNTREDRTLYFDFLQLELGQISGLTPQIHLYTVPGQAYYEASRKVVLRGADGVVFVADSAADRLSYNMRSWQQMQEHLTLFGESVVTFPVVLQCNKQDLPSALNTAVLTKLLKAEKYPVFPAVALEGQGVFASLKTIIHHVVRRAQSQLAVRPT